MRYTLDTDSVEGSFTEPKRLQAWPAPAALAVLGVYGKHFHERFDFGGIVKGIAWLKRFPLFLFATAWPWLAAAPNHLFVFEKGALEANVYDASSLTPPVYLTRIFNLMFDIPTFQRP